MKYPLIFCKIKIIVSSFKKFTQDRNTWLKIIKNNKTNEESSNSIGEEFDSSVDINNDLITFTSVKKYRRRIR